MAIKGLRTTTPPTWTKISERAAKKIGAFQSQAIVGDKFRSITVTQKAIIRRRERTAVTYVKNNSFDTRRCHGAEHLYEIRQTRDQLRVPQVVQTEVSHR